MNASLASVLICMAREGSEARSAGVSSVGGERIGVAIVGQRPSKAGMVGWYGSQVGYEFDRRCERGNKRSFDQA